MLRSPYISTDSAGMLENPAKWAIGEVMTANKKTATNTTAGTDADPADVDAWTYLRNIIQPKRELKLPKSNVR